MSTPWLSTWGCRSAVFLVSCGLSFSAAAETVPAPRDSEVAQMDALALSENQSLQAYKWRAEESRAQARLEGERLPQPMFEYMFDVGAPWTGHFSTGHSVRVMQRIPRRGAREALAAPARAEEQATLSMQAEAVVEVLRDIRLDLIEFARIDARVALIEEEIEILDDALGVVEAIIPVGRADHSDLLQLELARESALDEIEDLRARRQTKWENLAARVGVAEERLVEIGIPAELLDSWLDDLPDLPDTAQLVEWAEEYEPGLASIEARAVVADAQVAAVDQRVRPWPQLMAGYSNMPPMWEMDGPRNQMFQLGVSFEIPVFRSQYGVEASRWQAAHQAVTEERGQREKELSAQIEAAVARWESDRARQRRHENELLPLAQDLAQQVLIGVELGERSASDFLLALRQEIELERRILDLRAGLLRELMELQKLTGGRLGADTAWAYPTNEMSTAGLEARNGGRQ